jgi:hypothetical protein
MEELTEEELERIRRYEPIPVKKRRLALDSLIQELKRRGFKSLDESNPEDVAKIVKIARDMFPENSEKKIEEYSRVAIRLWNRAKR